jgi:hypothetical protein
LGEHVGRSASSRPQKSFPVVITHGFDQQSAEPEPFGTDPIAGTSMILLQCALNHTFE